MNNPLISLVTQSIPTPNDYRPTHPQRKAKAAFWSSYLSSGSVPPSKVDASLAARMSGSRQVLEWFQSQEFQDWFLNGDEFKQQVEYTSAIALDYLESVIQDDRARPGDRLAASKMVLEIGQKFPGKSKVEETNDKDPFQGMSISQVTQFILAKQQKLRLTPEDSTDIPVDNKDPSVVE